MTPEEKAIDEYFKGENPEDYPLELTRLKQCVKEYKKDLLYLLFRDLEHPLYDGDISKLKKKYGVKNER